MNLEKSNLFKKIFVQYMVPMNRALGIKLKYINDNETVLFLKKKHKNMNYSKTVHGAAIMALAETVHGMSVLNRIGAFNNIMVTKDLNLQFLKKATGDIQVCFELGKDRGDKIKKELQDNGKCEIELQCTVTDDNNIAIAVLDARYHIRKRKLR